MTAVGSIDPTCGVRELAPALVFPLYHQRQLAAAFDDDAEWLAAIPI